MKRKHAVSLAAWLASSYLVVILIGMSVGIILAWLTVEQMYLTTQRVNLLAQAELVAVALRKDTISSLEVEPYSQTSNIAPGIHTRVIDPEGAVVIGLSGADFATGTNTLELPELAQNQSGSVSPEELISRPEIMSARRGESATAIRTVDTANGRRVLYAAAPVWGIDSQGNAAVVQIIYLATPLPDTQWSALPASARGQFAGAVLIAILIGGLAGWGLARRISHPIVQFVSAAQAVGAGNLDEAVPDDHSITELAVLGGAFNNMTASLRQSDQVKTVFISDVTHELRTPLTIIKGAIETLQDGAIEDLTARESFLASMGRETERLIRLVNELLLVTRSDAGALNLQLQRVDLEQLVKERCSNLERTAHQQQVRLDLAMGSPVSATESWVVTADRDRIGQVLDNLLSNALRYSPRGADVQIRLSRRTGYVVCQVADSGPGIGVQHLPYIFERFYRADAARGRAQGGSGLGLTIVRSLVQAHGGGVEAASVEGQGATFTFWLPAPTS